MVFRGVSQEGGTAQGAWRLPCLWARFDSEAASVVLGILPQRVVRRIKYVPSSSGVGPAASFRQPPHAVARPDQPPQAAGNEDRRSRRRAGQRHDLNKCTPQGLDVSLTMDGVQTDLPARVDLFTYRIVQEALTNVLKHAGPNARTEVRLTTDNKGIGIGVLDKGHDATILPGSGHGILGMRERALLLGGSLDAGPRQGGGFQVVAHLPIGEEPA